MSDRFEKYVSMLPVEWERLVAMGVKYLTNELEAERVTLMKHENGVSIAIATDDENKQKAIEFWNDYVVPALNGD